MANNKMVNQAAGVEGGGRTAAGGPKWRHSGSMAAGRNDHQAENIIVGVALRVI